MRNERIVSYKMYKVLESTVRDGLISGLPYSELNAYEEFVKRMKEAEEPKLGFEDKDIFKK